MPNLRSRVVQTIVPHWPALFTESIKNTLALFQLVVHAISLHHSFQDQQIQHSNTSLIRQIVSIILPERYHSNNHEKKRSFRYINQPFLQEALKEPCSNAGAPEHRVFHTPWGIKCELQTPEHHHRQHSSGWHPGYKNYASPVFWGLSSRLLLLISAPDLCIVGPDPPPRDTRRRPKLERQGLINSLVTFNLDFLPWNRL